jgi:hypothetical protein
MSRQGQTVIKVYENAGKKCKTMRRQEQTVIEAYENAGKNFKV